jgi:hypothetical protein
MTDRLNATSQRSLLSILALLAALPRLLLVLAAPWVSKDPFGGTGHDGYLQVATRIATDATFALAPHHLLSRPPLYPLLLAPGIIFGIPFVWTASLQILLGVMTVLFVFLAVCEVSRSQSMAFACAAWVAVNPWLIWFTKNPMTPVTSTFIMSVLVLVYVKGLRSHKIAISQFSAVGALAALAALAHPALLPVVAGVALSLFLTVRGRAALRVAFLRVATVVVVFFIVLSPWLARNYALTGRFVASVDTAGFTYFASQDGYDGSLQPKWDHSGIASRLGVSVADLDVQYFTLNDEYNAQLNKLAVADMKTHHSSIPFLAKRYAINMFWLWFGIPGIAMSCAHLLYLLPIFALLIRATFSGYLRDVAVLLILIVPTICVHIITMSAIGHAAYSLPLLIPLIVGAAACSKNTFANPARKITSSAAYQHLSK